MIGLLLSGLLALGAAARAESSSEMLKTADPLPLSLQLTDETGEVAFRPTWRPFGESFSLAPSLRVGELALMGAFPAAYPILEASPYAVLGLKAAYTGSFEALGDYSFGSAWINSRKYFNDPQGAAASPANGAPKQTQFSQQYALSSYYGDLGYVAELGSSVKGAFFLAMDSFDFGGGPTGPADIGLLEGNAGSMWMYRHAGNEVSAFGDVRFEAARTQFFQNTADGEWATAARYGAEYMRDLQDHRVGLGVETQFQRADNALRPYLKWQHHKVAVLLAGNLRKSNDPFYPDVQQLGAEVRAEPLKGVSLSLAGYGGRDRYSMAPSATPDYSVTAQVSISLDAIFGAKVGARVADSGARRAYAPQASADMNARLPGAGYAFNFRNALAASPTFGDFVKSIPMTGGTDGILSAVSAFSASMGKLNYNANESDAHPNLDNIEQIYERARASYLSSTKDPILVCLGSAEFGAQLAQALGQREGIAIQAMGVSVAVPADDSGSQGLHAISMIKTPDYGIVLADWGRLTPTYTFDTKEALRIYQALQGLPVVYHDTTDFNGRHVGYLFTDEGKAMVRNLTFNADLDRSALSRVFNDDPRGDDLTVQRYRDILRSKFDKPSDN